ncbi:MAG: BatA domain-containing protein [Calditrichia bacterium]
MLNFLNPTILFALFAGFIPLIIHLLNRRKNKEIRFSTIHFLKQMARKEMRRLRIRQILLLIIRTLIILLVIFAFSRPTLRSGAGLLAGRSASEVVIIIDNSLSLNSLELTGNLLEKVRMRWINLEPAVKSGDRITVISGVTPLKILANRENYSSSLWQKIYKEIQPTSLKGNLGEAIGRASEIFKNSDLYNHELYIISDYQKAGLSSPQLKYISSELDERAKIFCLPVFHGSEENVSVDSAVVVNKLVEKNQPLKVEALLQTQSPEKNLTSMVSLLMGNNRVGQQNINIPPGEIKPVSFQTTLQSSGHVAGYAECESDALLEDNRYYYNLFVPENVRILHLLPSEVSGSFVPLILKPAIDNNIFIFDKNYLNLWTSIDFSKYKAVILEGVDQIPAGLAGRLSQITKRGTSVLIIPGHNLVPANMNAFLKNMGLGQILTLRGNPETRDETITIGKVNWEHPIFEGLFEKRKELNPIALNAYYEIRPSSKNEIIISLRNGDPFLIGSGQQSENTYLFAVPLQAQWTNLVTRGFVVPLFYRLLYYSVIQSVRERINIEAGRPFSEVFRMLQPPYEFTLKRPNGLEEKIAPVFKGSDILLEVSDNAEPGNYEIWQGNRLMTVYSVNHSPLESRQEYYGENDLLPYLPHSRWIPGDDKLIEQIEASRFGRELWPYILGLVLLLLFLEMVLAYTGSRKHAREMQKELAEV